MEDINKLKKYIRTELKRLLKDDGKNSKNESLHKLENIIQRTIRETLEEMSGTGGVAGYLSPNAFSDNGVSSRKQNKKIATQVGMSLVDENNYHEDILKYLKSNIFKSIPFAFETSGNNWDTDICKLTVINIINNNVFFKDSENGSKKYKININDLKYWGNDGDKYPYKLSVIDYDKNGTTSFHGDEDPEYSNDTLNKYSNRNEKLKESFDKSISPRKNLGEAIRTIKNGLNEIEKLVKESVRLKQENNFSSNDYWKRSVKAINHINERLVKITGLMKELQ